MLEGLVLKSTGSWYNVQLDDKSIIKCRMRGKFKLKGWKLTNPVSVGDRVRIEIGMEKEIGIIKHIFPRRNYVVRQSPRKKHNLHLIASNIDQAIVINTIVQPKLKQGFIDRYLLMTEPQDIPTIIIFNKSDLFKEKDWLLFEELKSIYEKIGYQVLAISALDGNGMEEFKNILRNKISLVGGQSGVGKSSILNSIDPDLELGTFEISEYSGKGQHTTTFAEMHELDGDILIIDTPGMKILSFNNLEPSDVAHNFREFFVASKKCKYHDCAHINEPNCAVKEAIENGEISILRYQNYLAIIGEIEDQNYWERITDM